MEENSRILISSSEDSKYFFLSTFYQRKIKEKLDEKSDEIEYNSVEQYYQSRKFILTDSDAFQKILEAKTPQEAFQLGSMKNFGILRPDWDSIKFDVMYQANKLKFEQHEDLLKKLIDTGKARISQYSKIDRYWSTSEKPLDSSSDSNVKQNGDLLGKILMDLRDDYFKNERKDR